MYAASSFPKRHYSAATFCAAPIFLPGRRLASSQTQRRVPSEPSHNHEDEQRRTRQSLDFSEDGVANDDYGYSMSSPNEPPAYKRINKSEQVSATTSLLKNLREDVLGKRLTEPARGQKPAEAVPLDATFRKRTPSAVLTASLKEAGYGKAVLPIEVPQREDLSYVSPRFVRHRTTPVVFAHDQPVSLQSILAEYIRASPTSALDVERKGDLIQVFSSANLRYLEKRSFDLRDVISWAWIVTAETSDIAASRLLMLGNSTSDSNKYQRNKAPVFLLMYVLRRHDLTGSAFRLLLVHAWNMLQNVHHPRWTIDFRRKDMTPKKAIWTSRYHGKGNYPDLDSETFVRLHVRLIQKAQSLWPEALDSIVMTMVRLQSESLKDKDLEPPAVSRLTFLYNRILSLVEKASRKNSFSSVYLNQRAQLTILRHMSDSQPRFMLNREGYQAVVKVQLRHRKTRRERDWALLKSKAWPPWKEDKYGLDADIGAEYGTSRAKQSLLRSIEAGYSPRTWEEAAGILSGWDTDSSPTIQTRAMLPNRSIDKRPKWHAISDASSGNLQDVLIDSDGSSQQHEKALIWATRIQATRTIEEAWSCFLHASRDTHGQARCSISICFAMFRKLVFARLQAKKWTLRSHDSPSETGNGEQTTPGDNLDVWLASQNPREQVYLAVPPPDEHEFIRDALQNGLQLGGAFLAFGLRYSCSFETGKQYLLQSTLDPNAIDMLLGVKDIDAHVIREKIPPMILAAYVRLLCQSRKFFSGTAHRSGEDSEERSLETSVVADKSITNPLQHAYLLLAASETTNRAPWYDLLAALANRKASIVDYSGLPARSKHYMQDTSSWESMLNLVRDMQAHGIPLDFEGLHRLSVGLEKAMFAARFVHSHTLPAAADLGEALASTENNLERHQKLQSYRSSSDSVLRDGVKQLKSLFLKVADNQTFIGDFPDNIDEAFAASGEEPPPITDEDGDGDINSATPTANNHDLAPSDNTPVTAPRTNSSVYFDSSHALPRLLDVPNAANLHAFMRVLGLAGDHQGIVDLLRWMARFAPEIGVLSSQVRNGRPMTRRVLTCARVMLEHWHELGGHEESPRVSPPSQSDNSDNESEERERHGYIGQAQDIVDFVEDWGGWPTDEECERYVGLTPEQPNEHMSDPYASSDTASSGGYYSGI